MNGITIHDFCAALYCAHVRGTTFGVDKTERIEIVARSVAEGVEEYYRVEFDTVKGFSWRDDAGQVVVVDPDYRLELSAIELERTTSGWRVWVNPYYSAVIEFSCARIRLNGAEVVGNGRWLQDELPTNRPRVPPFDRSRSSTAG